MSINVAFESLLVYILVFARMGGMIFFCPFLARRNVPSQIRVALVLGMTLILAPTMNPAEILQFSDIEMIVAILKELLVGVVCSFVFQIFYYLLFFAGDLMDMQFGMSMAKVFDPGSNIQMSVSGNLLSIMFMLFLFATDSHLLLIKIFASSYQIIPIGVPAINGDISGFFLSLFISTFSMLIRLTLPFIAAEFTMEVGMGVLMKLIPQIHVFVINIQFKMLMGILLLLVFAQPVADFLDIYMETMMKTMERSLFAIVG